jgi:hypothetical protein
MVLFDEFEKVYSSDEQEEMLTLLDGVFPSKKLFVMTCNNKWRVDQHMRNRPGRIFYMLDFKGLDADFIAEYCADNLKNKDNTDGVLTIGSLFAEFNFDMLKALVEEMNRYGETAQEAMKMLNAKPEFDEGSKYKVTVVPVGSAPLSDDQLDGEDYWEGNPLMQKRNWHFGYDPEPENDDSEYYRMQFSYRDLKKVEAKEGKFVYVNTAGDQLVLVREKERFTYNYHAM